MTGDEELDITAFIHEYKEYLTLTKYYTDFSESPTWNDVRNTACYWIEDSNKIILVPEEYTHRANAGPAASNMILEAILDAYNGDARYDTDLDDEVYTIVVDDIETTLMRTSNLIPFKDCEYRVEFVSRDTSTKIRMVKQEKCDYEYVQPFQSTRRDCRFYVARTGNV